MKVLHHIKNALSFKPIPVTVLAVVIYAVLFGSVVVTDELPDVPKVKRWKGLNLTEAYADLHVVAARPHPYNSHANTYVRAYILDRLQHIAAPHRSTVSVVSDLNSTASYSNVYFEGTNVLVKVEGTQSNATNDYEGGAVLFSAHYDSVSSAPGATDDGMGVVTLIQLVKYLTEHRPQRTAVFNLNNGEEDWLNGAHAFLEHPWANLTTTFLNLEGAAAGGRPLLFRATSLAPTRAFHVDHPHGNVLSADAFARGVIRSGTDYSVYAQGLVSSAKDVVVKPGMEGLDFAFYKGRSKYHTKYDSVVYTEGGQKALWAMMDSVRSASSTLLNTTKTEKLSERGEGVVYFDLLGHSFVVFSATTLLILDIVLLIVGPFAVLALLITVIIRARKEKARAEVENGVPEGLATGGSAKELILALIGWAKFWVALVIALVAEGLLVLGYVKLNPFIVHSRPILVIVSALAVAYMTLALPLTFSHSKPSKDVPPTSSRQQKLATLVEIYLLTWAFLLGATIALGNVGIGGLYWVTIWNALALIAGIFGLVEALFRVKHTKKSDVGPGLGQETIEEERGEEEERRLVRGVRYEVGGTDTGASDLDHGDHVRAYGAREDEGEGMVVETAPTEITPLMYQHRRNQPGATAKEEYAENDEVGWWIVQLLVLVPLPVMLISQVGIMLVNAMSQSLVDGSSATTVYLGIALLSLLVILPISPFIHKLHNGLVVLAAVFLIISLVFTWVVFPFNQDAPLKVSFKQMVHLDAKEGAPHAVTTLIGPAQYLQKRIVAELPSAWGADVNCTSTTDPRRKGLTECSWSSTLLPAHGSSSNVLDASSDDETSLVAPSPFTSATDWLQFRTKKTSPTSAILSVRGANTRNCRLYFDSAPISYYNVTSSNTSGDLQPGYEIADEGIKELRLWSRTWDREFEVEVEWKGIAGGTLEGRASCLWNEYASGAAGGPSSGGRIPAYEEVLAFLPKWAAATKRDDGLVEAWITFKI
ncbi:hypothetical protein PUNSTDRAFT_89945 [Punctularia strigosozonata HHB-11173 SS5]|uniref:uncharacterized protein n=1 Tax=Punctularia strigosozonata (strain HHB-11173) TaxID=741275 RepID=UPI0004416464|nr:uncharacterized protein PUNSTDRAFT_89945 [Punctularia strigosozonata HHB-11173 SS5]EIN06389.1 hypothetical protein PUNSTDRAFT_89945 [Punctularia strigosozonata HHB-11173 SS5]